MSRRTRFFQFFLTSTSAAGLGGCILLVDLPSQVSGNCPFAGKEEPCGRCIARECQSAVDACCGDESCSGRMSDLDACARKGGTACEAIAFPLVQTTASAALAACFKQHCGESACGNIGNGSGATSTACSVSTSTYSPPSCTCNIPSSDKPRNSVECGPDVVANSICCADLDWPLAGTDCTCQQVSCRTSNSGEGCTCDTYSSGPLTSCSTGGNCCSGLTDCQCGALAQFCPTEVVASYQRVSSCGAATMGCGSGQKRIARCSAQ